MSAYPTPEPPLGPVRTVAIAGAAGFVGSALTRRLATRDRVLSLGRRHRERPPADAEADTDPDEIQPGIEPRRCDLFSVRQTRDALVGANVAVYLVHSMSPNARLTQGNFADLDLLIADNFGRAAAETGVERIIYLGGLLPESPDGDVSSHLASRREVELALAAHGVPVTAVRAGLVVGPDGSSLNLLVKLVERLPMMVCPSWTASKTQPIALADVVEILAYCCHTPSTAGRVGEVGGPDVMTYRDMMKTTAEVLDRTRPMVPVPLVSPALSELWVALVTGTSRSLVRPLIESLRHPMVVSDPWLQEEMGLPGRPFAEALRESISQTRGWKRPFARSVQRLPLPPGRDAVWLGESYMAWLERALSKVLRVDRSPETVTISLRARSAPLLVLQRRRDLERSGRYVLAVVGGDLAAPTPSGDPRLEFRVTPAGDQALAALQDFAPRLPWWIYLWTQAPLHSAVMRLFRRWVSRQGGPPIGAGVPSPERLEP